MTMQKKNPQATRIAFIIENNQIFEKKFTFDFFGGFALSQKHKTINSFHNEILKYKKLNILEVSRKSLNSLGNMLSAFNLMIQNNGKLYPIETIYQSSKIFNNNIIYHECLSMTPLEAKRYIKELQEKYNLNIIGFKSFLGIFPNEPPTFFYDYLYVYALNENKILGDQILKYNCFTDIEFNQNKQFASQARSCAIFKFLSDNNILNEYLNDLCKFQNIYFNFIIKDENVLF